MNMESHPFIGAPDSVIFAALEKSGVTDPVMQYAEWRKLQNAKVQRTLSEIQSRPPHGDAKETRLFMDPVPILQHHGIPASGSVNLSNLKYSALTAKSAFSNQAQVDTDYRYSLLQRASGVLRKCYTWFIVHGAHGLMSVSYLLRMFDFAHNMLLVLLGVLTYICYRYNIINTFNPFLLLFTIVMPISFAVNCAYSRRQEALALLSEFRARCVHVHMFTKLKAQQSAAHEAAQVSVEATLRSLYHTLREYLTSRDEFIKRHALHEILMEVYRLHEYLHVLSLGEANRDIEVIIGAWAKLRNIADYQTPLSVRIFAQFSIILMPLSFAPYAAGIMHDANGNVAAMVVGAVLCGALQCCVQLLFSVHRMIENPFSAPIGKGYDTINLDYMNATLNGPLSPCTFPAADMGC